MQPARFVAGSRGPWRIVRIAAASGAPLDAAPALDVIEDDAAVVAGSAWVLRGVRSHDRYTTRPEKDQLTIASPSLGRPRMEAALIPIRKSAAWWQLAQDERRAVLERSRHFAIGLEYLPAVARRLYHSRDLGEEFDFLTWFEFDPADAPAFDRLLARLRATEEWQYVDRGVEVRLVPASKDP